MFWTLWKMRNELYFYHQVHKPEMAILRASKVVWTPPMPSNVKLNVDVAWRQQHIRRGLGYVLRDDHGILLLAVSKPGSFLSVSIGDALAIKAGLLRTVQAGYSNVTVESDNLEVIQMLQRKTTMADPYYILRTANVVAHVLARKALSYIEQVFWLLTSPWLVDMCKLNNVSDQ
ncbi:hypothetical protein NE237_022210 [Protea cynaroides]|uniref:RNase H type-1 domain-containing protein n=1 Tax=Protea cynaroides TaxID=273540 RepID=A0A9Q0H968_9MAGN|nr:hypothetical protein NE237_022210 [Protea cynaroides]